MTASGALRRSSQEVFMVIGLGVGHLQPLVALLAGVLILLVPRILNYVIAIYLIIDGIIGFGLIR
jgi:hypothetical protein